MLFGVNFKEFVRGSSLLERRDFYYHSRSARYSRCCGATGNRRSRICWSSRTHTSWKRCDRVDWNNWSDGNYRSHWHNWVWVHWKNWCHGTYWCGRNRGYRSIGTYRNDRYDWCHWKRNYWSHRNNRMDWMQWANGDDWCGSNRCHWIYWYDGRFWSDWKYRYVRCHWKNRNDW